MPRHRDALGRPVEYRYTTDMPCDECDYCRAGVCVQRVESSPAWHCDVVVHDTREGHES